MASIWQYICDHWTVLTGVGALMLFTEIRWHLTKHRVPKCRHRWNRTAAVYIGDGKHDCRVCPICRRVEVRDHWNLLKILCGWTDYEDVRKAIRLRNKAMKWREDDE